LEMKVRLPIGQLLGYRQVSKLAGLDEFSLLSARFASESNLERPASRQARAD